MPSITQGPRLKPNFILFQKKCIFDIMSILVNTHNEQEEKVLLAFLNSLRFNYKTGVFEDESVVQDEFIVKYNSELDESVADIEAGNSVLHEDVEKLFSDRRKALK